MPQAWTSSPPLTLPARFCSVPEAFGGRLGGAISSKMHGKPAFAKCAAMRAPIVPAPSTTAFSIRRLIVILFRVGQVTKPAFHGQTRCPGASARIKIEQDAGRQ